MAPSIRHNEPCLLHQACARPLSQSPPSPAPLGSSCPAPTSPSAPTGGGHLTLRRASPRRVQAPSGASGDQAGKPCGIAGRSGGSGQSPVTQRRSTRPSRARLRSAYLIIPGYPLVIPGLTGNLVSTGCAEFSSAGKGRDPHIPPIRDGRKLALQRTQLTVRHLCKHIPPDTDMNPKS